jgi:phage gpG-like protein
VIRGDAMRGIEAIGRLKDTIRKLSDLPRATAVEAQEPINRLLRAEFRSGTDPYGQPWEPVKPQTIERRRVSRASTPLTDTRKLASGTRVELRLGNRAGLLIVTGAPYAYFHQVGFRAGRTPVPARRVLPQFGLPAGWKLVLRDAARRAARKAVA